MVGGKHMMQAFFLFSLSLHYSSGTTQETVSKPQEVSGAWSSILLNVKVNQRYKMLSPATSNTISIDGGVLKLQDTLSAPTQHTFSIVTVFATQYRTHINCMGKK